MKLRVSLGEMPPFGATLVMRSGRRSMSVMPSLTLQMPECGEAGVLIATRDDGVRVEFRGRPYHLWDEAEDSPMFRLHSLLRRINISQLHCGQAEVMTPWHPEWPEVSRMFEQALGTCDA